MTKKKQWIIGILMLFILIIACFSYAYFTTPRMTFIEDKATLEINTTEYDPMAFIKQVSHGEIEDVDILDNTVKTDTLGTYQIRYQLHKKISTLQVMVVDRIAPKVTTKELRILSGETPTAQQCIETIEDATACTASFQQPYTFDTIGDLIVGLQVADEGGNITKVETTIHILEKDTTPPVITANDVRLQSGDAFDASSYASASDANDGNVEVTVTKNTVDTSKPGTYEVSYAAKDKQGNQATKTIQVIVNRKTIATNGKVMYLTIDDGPSANTPAVLDILDTYNVKATFFVTAQCPQYFEYIALAYQKGHAIGLHSYSHAYERVYANDASYFSDLQAISDVVYEQTGTRSTLIRFPGGSSNTISANYNQGIMSRLTTSVQQRGYQYFDWNASSGDGNSATPTDKLITNAKSYGGQSPLMMLTHDHAGSKTSIEALPAIIEYYQSQGYTFLTVASDTKGFHHGVNN